MLNKAVRVLVVDDDALCRKAVAVALAEIEGVEVVGLAPDGRTASGLIESLRPDIMTLDFDMSEIDGFDILRNIKEGGLQIEVVIVTSQSREGAKTALNALEIGAFAFLAKPKVKSLEESKGAFLAQLKPIMAACVVKKMLGKRKESFGLKPPLVLVKDAPVVQKTGKSLIQEGEALSPPGFVRIVGIGVSTGGPQALSRVIPFLPGDLRVPVVVVQHMPPVFTGALAESLGKKSKISVVEGADGMPLAPGVVYIAPGGRQMKVVRKGPLVCLAITDDPPENHCRPSADYLFRSIAEVYGNRSLGVIMTGMGLDGTLGLRLMKERGASVIAQDEASCVVFGMPMEAINAGVVDVVRPLSAIAGEIVKRVN